MYKVVLQTVFPETFECRDKAVLRILESVGIFH